MVHSEARTRFDDVTKKSPSNSWTSWENAQMLCFPLSREYVPVEPGTAISPSVRFGHLFIYPTTLKSAGYYVIPSVQKFAFECPSVHLSFCLSFFIRGMLHHIKFKLILIDFNNVAGLLVNVTFVSISTDMKIADSLYFLRFVKKLPTFKQEFSIYLHKSQDLRNL